MRKSGYLKRLEGDLKRWVEQGLIDTGLRDRLAADAAAHDRVAGGGSSPILAVLAMAAFIVGVLAVVAANWSNLGGYARLALAFGALGAAIMTSGALSKRGSVLPASLSALLGAALFGAGIITIGQLYHSGASTSSFYSAWAIGAGAIAALLGSSLAAAFAAALGIVWTLTHAGDAAPVFVDGVKLSAPLWAPVLWAGLGALAVARRSLGLVHVIAIGVVFWVSMILADWYEVRSSVYFSLFLAIFWGGVAAAAEGVVRATNLWATRTIAGWAAWTASGALVSAAAFERVKPVFFTELDLATISLAIFSALTAYGAAPGRRWLRGAGVAGFIATALIFFTLADSLMTAGVTLIIFSIALAGLIIATNRMLTRARAAAGEAQ
ncbi:MAG: DUF2157 domain-containing protein [Pseudomonadota bacterium]